MSQALIEPWYRQFWPWFLIALPASAVVAGLVTLGIALQNPPDLVADDYYRAGLAVNRDQAKEAAAAALGVSAKVRLQPRFGLAIVDLPGRQPGRVAIAFRHHLEARLDRVFWLEPGQDGVYRAAEPVEVPPGRWDVTLEPESGAWRLHDRLELPGVALFKLSPTSR
ncbi:MAG: FixH family protein [Gammaproteobacteria bacterium]|nr:FixH family protein [Gammaproteobacteria bacterium]